MVPEAIMTANANYRIAEVAAGLMNDDEYTDGALDEQ